MQNDTWIKVGTSKPIGLPQVKDGDIRLRWISLAWHRMMLRVPVAVNINIQAWRGDGSLPSESTSSRANIEKSDAQRHT